MRPAGLALTELARGSNRASGPVLRRPELERLRDLAVEGRFEVLLCLAPDRLARRYAYQVLLLEEFQRAGVEVSSRRSLSGPAPRRMSCCASSRG